MYLIIPLDDPNKSSTLAPIGANLICDLPDEIDFIEAFTGHANLTHAWNEFCLKAEVVEQVLQGK